MLFIIDAVFIVAACFVLVTSLELSSDADVQTHASNLHSHELLDHAFFFIKKCVKLGIPIVDLIEEVVEHFNVDVKFVIQNRRFDPLSRSFFPSFLSFVLSLSFSFLSISSFILFS